jgi:Mg2+ and Co2+ transporter CorA
MKLSYQPSEEVLNNISKFAEEGFFVKKELHTRTGIIKYTGKNFVHIPSKRVSFGRKTEGLKVDVRVLFSTYACEMGGNVFFVPNQNVDEFLREVGVIKKKVVEINDSMIENHDSMILEVREIYRGVLHWKWVNEFKNTGSPPEAFVEAKTAEYIEKFFNKDKMKKIASFEIFPVNVFIDKKYERFGNIEELNKRPIMKIAESIIRRRIDLFYVLDFARKNVLNSPYAAHYKRFLNRIFAFKKSIFYGDQFLLDKIEFIKKKIVLSESRDKVEVSDTIEEVMNYLIENKEFYLGFQYAKK